MLVVVPGGRVVDQCTVELGQALELELLKRLDGTQLCATQPHGELFTLAPRELVAAGEPMPEDLLQH